MKGATVGATGVGGTRVHNHYYGGGYGGYGMGMGGMGIGVYPMGYGMMSPFGYGLFGTPIYYGGGGMWTWALLAAWRCKAYNHEGIRCNGSSGLFSSYCRFHRDGAWRE